METRLCESQSLRAYAVHVKKCVLGYGGVWVVGAWDGVLWCVGQFIWDEITYPFLNFNGATVEV